MAEDVHLEGYDEDLSENPFFKYLQTKHKALYDEVAKNRWTICMPRRGTLSRSNHTHNDVESHIIQPVEQSPSIFRTLNAKGVQVNDGFIITTKGFQDVKSVRILFEETFFNSNNESFQVLCLDQPLEGGIGVSAEPVVQTLEDLQGCIDFLWPSTGNKQGQKQIDEIIQMRSSTYQQLEGESMRHLMDAANAIYTRAMQGALKNWQLRKLARNNKSYLDNVKLAMETYVMHGLYTQLMKGISAIVGNEDAALNKITRNLAEIQIRDIGIKLELCPNLPKARRILSLLNKFTSPLEKFHCLKKSIIMITERKLKENEQGSGDAVTADDLLPALVFLVIKSDIPNWLANITFLHNFHFSKCGYSEFQFYLSSLEAAVEHVRSGYVSNEFKGGSPFKRLHNRVQWQPVDHDSSKPTALDKLFEFAADGNETEVGKLLANEESDQSRLDKMCHPLCSCDKCEKLLSSKRNDPSAVTVFSRDDMGRTVLHVSSEWGHANLTYNLIHKGAVVNAMDYHGTTPLHLACLRGHNKVVLLLVHYKADNNSTDNDGNTPLHLCAANGHEHSLKSLLYCDMQTNVLKINASNENGDTPLHLASRWGYVEIVQQLIEKGASVEARNKNKSTPLECAHNQQVSDLLLDVTASNIEMESDLLDSDKSKSLDISRSPSRSSLAGSPTSSLENTPVREVATFLRTVADGDFALVCYRLGLEDEEDEEEEEEEEDSNCRSEQDLCHPLCQCEKCSKWQKLTQRSLERAVHANCTNEDGIAATHVAAVRGYENITSLLLRHGANPNHRNTTRQQTALHLACQYNHPNVVELLLNHQAKINAKDYKGNTPLHFCCINGHVGPAIVLLQRRASVDVVNDRGNTPLHEAARWNFVELVRLLLRYRASVTFRNKMQLTPMQYAKHDDVVRILENAERLAESLSRSARASTWSGMTTMAPNKTFEKTKTDSFEVGTMVSGSPPRIGKHGGNVAMATDIPQARAPEHNRPRNTSSEESNTRSSSASSTRLKETGNSPARVPASPSRVRVASDSSICDTSIAAPQTKLSQIFEQLEGGDVEKLQEIAKAVRAFDRRKSLKRTVTIDKSTPLLDLHRQRQVPIDFENITLRKTDSIDEDDPGANSNLLERVRKTLTIADTPDAPQQHENPAGNADNAPLLERIRKKLLTAGSPEVLPEYRKPAFSDTPLLERLRKYVDTEEEHRIDTLSSVSIETVTPLPSTNTETEKVIPSSASDGTCEPLIDEVERAVNVKDDTVSVSIEPDTPLLGTGTEKETPSSTSNGTIDPLVGQVKRNANVEEDKSAVVVAEDNYVVVISVHLEEDANERDSRENPEEPGSNDVLHVEDKEEEVEQDSVSTMDLQESNYQCDGEDAKEPLGNNNVLHVEDKEEVAVGVRVEQDSSASTVDLQEDHYQCDGGDAKEPGSNDVLHVEDKEEVAVGVRVEDSSASTVDLQEDHYQCGGGDAKEPGSNDVLHVEDKKEVAVGVRVEQDSSVSTEDLQEGNYQYDAKEPGNNDVLCIENKEEVAVLGELNHQCQLESNLNTDLAKTVYKDGASSMSGDQCGQVEDQETVVDKEFNESSSATHDDEVTESAPVNEPHAELLADALVEE